MDDFAALWTCVGSVDTGRSSAPPPRGTSRAGPRRPIHRTLERQPSQQPVLPAQGVYWKNEALPARWLAVPNRESLPSTFNAYAGASYPLGQVVAPHSPVAGT